MAAPSSLTRESPLKKSGSGPKAHAFTVQANMKNVQVLFHENHFSWLNLHMCRSRVLLVVDQ